MKRDLNATLTVLARGYETTVLINGIDIGIKGCKSESLKLFGKDSPSMPVLPEDMKNQICLQEGQNSLSVTYKRLEKSSADKDLIIELQTREQQVNGANIIYRKESIKAGDKKSFTETFTF